MQNRRIYTKNGKTHFPDKLNNRFVKKPLPAYQFKHLFNSYTRWFNIKHKRKDSLFAKNFEYRLVDNEQYFKNLIIYINNNPVHHGFVEHPIEYSWSSYLSVLSLKPTKLNRKAVIGYFDNVGNFRTAHDNQPDNEIIKDYIIE